MCTWLICEDIVRPINPGISHFLNTQTRRRVEKTVAVAGHQREWSELCLCVFKVARQRKVHPELSASSTFTQRIGMLGM